MAGACSKQCPKPDEKFRPPFQRWQGCGGRAPAALPLTLKGRRAKEKGEAVRGSTPSVRPWHQPAPPTIPNSVNPLTWETSRFPSHGELRTGLPKRGGPKRCYKMPLPVGKPLIVRPLPQSQQHLPGTLSLPTRVQGVRLSPKVRKAPLS